MQATRSPADVVAIAKAAVRNPANASAIGALTDLLWAMHRSRLMYQRGTPATALLVQLARTGPLRASDLAADMNLALSTVSRQLASLEADGLVSRSPDLGDGRASLVEVTDGGRARAEALIASRVHQLEAVIDTWSAADREELARLLQRFTAGFDARPDHASAQPATPAQPATTTKDSW